jgi:aconitate hydratase
MGQAPATDKISLRTVPRNFPGRSGTREDKVCLVSPETAAASAITGVITDPRDLGPHSPRPLVPEVPILNTKMLQEPPPPEKAQLVELAKGPNIVSLPSFEKLASRLEVPILLKLGDDISTDEIIPAGARVLPFRSNIPKISEFAFEPIDASYYRRAVEARDEKVGHAVIGGHNYGQGSSREHAALAPRYLGLRVVIAKSFSRIHWQNLVNFGILPLTLTTSDDYDRLNVGDTLLLENLLDQILPASPVVVRNLSNGFELRAQHRLSSRQCDVLKDGGLINWARPRVRVADSSAS